MKQHFIQLIFMSLFFVTLSSCDKEEQRAPGNPEITVNTDFATAYFADSLSFSVDVSDAGVPLSTVKAQLYYGDAQVSETVIRTKEYGRYEGKIFVPYYGDIPNGGATLRFVLQNVSLMTTSQDIRLPLERPDYPYLTLVTEDGDRLRMDRTTLYQYEIEQQFLMKVRAYIEAPAYGANGNVVTFGAEGSHIREGINTPISFSYISDAVYPIVFNTLTYEAGPFMSYSINGTDLLMVADDLYRGDFTLSKDQQIIVDGISDLDTWWIDVDYFREENGQLFFNAINGSYRITADFARKYFIIEALQGGDLAKLNPDGTGAIWIIGEGIGKPNLSNQVGWDTGKALCMAPIGNKRYRVTVVAGETVNSTSINFKFFSEKGWGGEFGNERLTTDSDVIFVGNGSNGRDNGNLGLVTGQQLDVGATYVLTVDVSAGLGNAVLHVEKQ